MCTYLVDSDRIKWRTFSENVYIWHEFLIMSNPMILYSNFGDLYKIECELWVYFTKWQQQQLHKNIKTDWMKEDIQSGSDAAEVRGIFWNRILNIVLYYTLYDSLLGQSIVLYVILYFFLFIVFTVPFARSHHNKEILMHISLSKRFLF